MRLDRQSPVPLYVRVRAALKEEIARLRPGEPVPTEQKLQEMFGVSRITVRRAVDDLVTEGLLERRQGVGTFVRAPKLTHQLGLITSWTETIRQEGHTPGTATRIVKRVEPPPGWVQEMLGTPDDEPVVMVYRVRTVNGEPFSLMYNYLRARLVPGLEEHLGRYESLYEVLEKVYYLRLGRAVDTVEARRSTPDEAAVLGIEPGSPAIQVTRVTYLANEEPLEVVRVVSNSEKYQYRVTLTGRP